jgi:hypothetical protein
MIHDAKRVEALRAGAQAGLKALTELQLKTTDPSFHQMLVMPRNWFGDIEAFFIRQLEAEERTAAREAWWLSAAEQNLAMTNQQLKHLQGLFTKYGPNIQVIG